MANVYPRVDMMSREKRTSSGERCSMSRRRADAGRHVGRRGQARSVVGKSLSVLLHARCPASTLLIVAVVAAAHSAVVKHDGQDKA